MKKVININFQGQVIAIEETAYEILKQYIESLKRYFSREEDGEEIVNDIEGRIAELFGNRLKLGINCITDEDVETIVANIGRPEDFDSDFEEAAAPKSEKETAGQPEPETAEKASGERHLYRNINDKILGGVCSGIAHYLKTDSTFIRFAFVLLFFWFFWVYLVLWIVLKPMPLESNISKRLYRNPSDKVLGGVCGGLATYFKIDSRIPRLLFALPLILNLIGVFGFFFFPLTRLFDGDIDFNFRINGGVLVAYVVLWIIIPKASSVKQKLEMMGEDEYIKSIRSTVSDNVASVKSKMENEPSSDVPPMAQNIASQPADIAERLVPSTDMPPEPPKATVPKTSYHAPERPQPSGCLTAIVLFLKIVFFGFVGIFAISAAAAFFSFLFAGVNLGHFKSLFIAEGVETNLFWITIILLFGIPPLASILWIIRRIARAKPRPAIGYVAVSLWVLGFVSGGVLSSKIMDKFKVEGSSTQSITLTQPAGNKLYVDMEAFPSDYYSVQTSFGTLLDISGLPWLPFYYYAENEDSLLFNNISLKIVESKDSLYHLRTEAVSFGCNPKEAKYFAANFAYPVRQQDSLLLLPEFFRVPFAQGFRTQGLEVEIAVPLGKRIEISDRLEGYKHRIVNIGRKGKRGRVNIRQSKPSRWKSDEEYIMRDGKLIETVLKTDSI